MYLGTKKVLGRQAHSISKHFADVCPVETGVLRHQAQILIQEKTHTLPNTPYISPVQADELLINWQWARTRRQTKNRFGLRLEQGNYRSRNYGSDFVSGWNDNDFQLWTPVRI